MKFPLSFAGEVFGAQNGAWDFFGGFPLTPSPTARPTSAAGVLQAGASVVATIVVGTAFVWLVALAM